MVNSVLVDYFKEGLAKGNSVQILRKTLIDAGWPEVEVNGAANEVKPVKIGKPFVREINENPLRNDFAGPKKRPVGVSMVAIFHWLLAVGLVLYGVIAFFMIGSLSSIFGSFEILSLLFLIGPIILALLPFFVGRSIWKGKNEGRITAIVFGILAILGAVYGLMEFGFLETEWIISIVDLIISGYVVGYLSLNKKGKVYFKKKN